jgi:hypothetical protein
VPVATPPPATAPLVKAPSKSPVTAKKAAAAAAQTASLEVIHLHRLGDCRGRLDVSRDGLAFVSDEKEDAFRLTFAEFLHAVSDDTLTLRSAAKTYRFKAAGAGGDKLHEFADRISRARR